MNLNPSMLNFWRQTINGKQAELTVHTNNLKELENKVSGLVAELEFLQISRSLFQKAAQLTQEKLSVHISDLVSLALRSVFVDPYEFRVMFETKRNSTECVLDFVRNGHTYKPLDSCGYGAADVASFALRIAYWSLGSSRPVLLWDEPFRHLSKHLQTKAATMIERLSKELSIQIIIITHSDELAEAANRVFQVSMENEVSKVVAI